MINNIPPQKIQDYWDHCTDLYLPYMTTFQAGLFAHPHSDDPFHDNAVEIAKRADIRSGQRVLDLGCGVCGPAIEIASYIRDVSFVCVTNCARQVEVANQRVGLSGLKNQIELVLMDYHDVSKLSGPFDRCLFLESFGYTLTPASLMSSVFDILRPGGQLYAKDVCHKWNLSDAEKIDLSLFNETYCYNTPLLNDVRQNALAAGFDVEKSEVITAQMYRSHSRSSMFVDPDVSDELTDFGQRHFKGFTSLPIDFYELKAAKSG
jgi:cyclopropane fatty-acyl-phospholipid synthase-like methyltransferase